MWYRYLSDPDFITYNRPFNELVAEGVLVPVEPDPIDIAAKLSIGRFADIESPLVLAIVADTIAALKDGA